eukprot:14903940-Alexandrium_andersonii.AAC.1
MDEIETKLSAAFKHQAVVQGNLCKVANEDLISDCQAVAGWLATVPKEALGAAEAGRRRINQLLQQACVTTADTVEKVLMDEETWGRVG